MGLPLEQWRGGGEAEGKDPADAAAAGCRTPAAGNGQAAARGGGRAAGGECPAAPRKRRAPAGEVAQRPRRDFYNGDDVEAFFAAHNL
ncbi:hypothetical protein HU200_018077 [Digitaria exilis]|uniref:Uncharacterized protein n=1 Tax=Digitaria exilis TaxID=1010633 RepID=A0A835F5B8_9POAL|nr:hypothetical protein HU200_018077 [Digitaria exilis]